MEVLETELFAQLVSGIFPGFLDLQLTNHVSGSLTGIALVSSDLVTSLKKKPRADGLITNHAAVKTYKQYRNL